MPNTEGFSQGVASFLAGTRDPANFRHVDHVRAAFEILKCKPFLEGAALYAGALKILAAKAGKPGLYNETITVAFLSLIAERLDTAETGSFEEFVSAHPDLLRKAILQDWYTPERLHSPLARRTFVLPARTPC